MRGDATLFIVEPGHVNASVEGAIEKYSAYHLVRKLEGLPQRIAKRTDPDDIPSLLTTTEVD